MLERLYRIIFWIGYIVVIITTLIPIKRVNFNKITFGPEAFHISLDHLLHFAVYFIICVYYLVGWKKGFSLFDIDPLRKFVLLVLFMGVITELIQLWVPERAFNVFDMLSNVAGLVAGVGVIRMAQGSPFAKAMADKSERIFKSGTPKSREAGAQGRQERTD